MQFGFEKLIAVTLIVFLIAFVVWAITSRNKQLRSYLLFGAIPVLLLLFIPVAWRIADDYSRDTEVDVTPDMGERPVYSYNYESDADINFYSTNKAPAL